MDVLSTELGIWLSFVKTSEFREEGEGVAPPPPSGTPLILVVQKITTKLGALKGYIGQVQVICKREDWCCWLSL
jgi:hypothetical protein